MTDHITDEPTVKLSASTILRFQEKINKRGPDECWEWLGYRAKSGHGRLNVKGKVHLAHRIAYELQNGAIPPDLVVRHKCNFPPCCNPAHLELGTQGDNVRDRFRNKEPIKDITHPLPGARPWARFNGKKATPAERFWDKVDKSGDCWLWTAATFPRGYGHFLLDGFNHLAHRYAWELENGPIPDGLILLHQCDTPGCVRVSHLRLGTHADNNADMMEKGRGNFKTGSENASYGKLRTHCAKGHEMTEDNVIFTNHGEARRCLICYRASSRAGALRYLDNHREDVNQKRRERREPLKTGAATGERHGLTTLTDQQVMEIRRISADGNTTFLALAAQYHVTPSTIGNIVRRKTWKHIP